MTIALIIAILAAFFFYFLYKLSLKKRLNLSSYITLLLLEPAMAKDHAEKLKVLIHNYDKQKALALTKSVHNSIEFMADGLSKTSILGAHAAVWQEKKKSMN